MFGAILKSLKRCDIIMWDSVAIGQEAVLDLAHVDVVVWLHRPQRRLQIVHADTHTDRVHALARLRACSLDEPVDCITRSIPHHAGNFRP